MEENIKVLSEKDRVRKKISVWLGSNNHNAVRHCILELIGNSCDEINKGNGNEIKITLIDSKTISIQDNCKGLPIEGMGQKEVEGVGIIEVPNYQLVTAHLFAGTKYDNGLDGNDTYSVGTNGVFLTVLSRSSETCEYEIARPNGNVYRFSYYKGDEKEPMGIVGRSDKTYTKITYKLDDEIFEENQYSAEEIIAIAKEQASLIKGRIVVIDTNGKETVCEYENGIKDLLLEKTSELNVLSEPIQITKDVGYFVEKVNANDIVKIDMMFQYSREDEAIQTEFLNGSNLIHHGTIYEGIIQGLKIGLNKFMKDSGMYQKNEKQITNDDVLTGLNYVINFKSYFPIFENQTKFGTTVVYYKDIMKEVLVEYLEVIAIENKEVIQKIATQILLNKRVREKADNNRQKIKKELEEKADAIQTRPSKYVPCRSKDRTKKKLILIEGDSALNAVTQGRDKYVDSIFPLKGKPINCLKKSIDEIIKNEEVRNIIKLTGCGVSYKGKQVKGLPKFNIDNVEFCEVDILSDGDEDGYHIRCLLIGMFHILMPEIISSGRLLVLEAPLYRITQGNVEYIAYDEMEKNRIIEGLKGKYVETRFKGLGGLNPQLTANTIMSMENRRAKVITMEDAKESIRMLEMFLDDDSSDRKQYIAEHGDKYFDYSIYED